MLVFGNLLGFFIFDVGLSFLRLRDCLCRFFVTPVFRLGVQDQGRSRLSIIFMVLTVTGSISVLTGFFGLNWLFIIRHQIHNLHLTLFLFLLNFPSEGAMGLSL